MNGSKNFDGVLYGIGENIRRTLEFLPDKVKCKVQEIRLRTGLPVCLTVGGKTYFVKKDGTVCDYINADILKSDKKDLKESFMLLCNDSVYAHTGELKNGYIKMRSGHRAGICGTFDEQGNFKNVSSINIRIAHEVLGCADALFDSYNGNGLLIAGRPGSGKTTILRDLIRQLSSDKYLRVAVIDSRGELSGSFLGESINDLGVNTDILMIQNKALGVEIAVRTLFPNIVAFDEIGTSKELLSVSDSFNAGVSVITTAHAGSISDLLTRSVTNGLLRSGAVSQVAMLSEEIGKAPEILSVKEILCELNC